ncbi:S1C family serine protease [Agarilytica rhodophyticola]|uniref:S1C family serine protease n=1 Tax=Agarilytica rhodophyticola TaxID=1737490 RepID=UPI000B343923|nr:trypsin-like peptidase domain-containing protein [Agarilytica rhodophyticola]
MSSLKALFLFVRWPVTLGLLAALLVLTFSPAQLKFSLPKFVQTEHTGSSKNEWIGPVSYSDAVSKASQSVVNIYTRKQVEQKLHPLFKDPIFRLFFNSADIPRRKRMQSALGSGVIVTKEGHILTNYHVIGGADEIVVALEDGRNAHAQVLGENRERDLAILKIELDNLQPVSISEDISRVGDVVLAIGNPFGVGQTVTQGIISATRSRNRNLNISTFENFIQTDAAIHPGSSGGALIDVHGNLLGINTANLDETGSGGIGFAVPVDIAMQTLNDIVKFGRVVRGWLGVEAQALQSAAAQNSGFNAATGVVITRTMEGGPAEKAGLKRGDIIIGIRGNPVKEVTDIIQMIQESRPGETVTIEFIRGGEVASLDVVLQEQPLAAS